MSIIKISNDEDFRIKLLQRIDKQIEQIIWDLRQCQYHVLDVIKSLDNESHHDGQKDK